MLKLVISTTLFSSILATPVKAESQQEYVMKHSREVLELQMCVQGVILKFESRYGMQVFRKKFAPIAMETCSIEISATVARFGAEPTNDVLKELQQDAADVLDH